MPDEKNCFVIMPITTPESLRDNYRDGDNHFSHVLQCLFIPSIERAGYVAIPPTAKGADLIHAEIVRNLETADLVLCDMSCLNPNVFFEFGIRTSLNKPVSVVKDEVTKKVPFDTAILNYQEYKSTLNPWELEAEISKLAEHLNTSAKRSKGENTLWRYFGLKSEVTKYQVESGAEAKLDYLILQIDSLREKIDNFENAKEESIKDTISTEDRSIIAQIAGEIAPMLEQKAEIIGYRSNEKSQRRITYLYTGKLSPPTFFKIQDHVLNKFGWKIEFERQAK